MLVLLALGPAANGLHSLLEGSSFSSHNLCEEDGQCVGMSVFKCAVVLSPSPSPPPRVADTAERGKKLESMRRRNLLGR